MEFVLSEYQYIQPLIEKYNTKYFDWCALFNVKQRNKQFGKIFLYSFCIYTLPVAVYYIVKPEYYTQYYNLLINIESGELEFYISEEVRRNDDRDFLNSRIYDTFFQIKARRKK